MPSYRLQTTLQEFDEQIDRAANLALRSRSLQSATGVRLHVRDQEEIAGLCLIKHMLAWESFIEDSFIKYICGASSIRGNRPPLIAPRIASSAVAFSMLLGRSRYLDWNRFILDARARTHFTAGAPFSAVILSAARDLDDIVAVRNRIAHRSQFSKVAFQTTVRNQLSYFPRGMTPGRFLMIQVGGQTTLERYARVLQTAAYLIANY